MVFLSGQPGFPCKQPMPGRRNAGMILKERTQ